MSAGTDDLETLLTEEQLRQRWQLASAKKLQADRVKRTGCPYIKIGRLVRYRLSDIVTHETNNRVAPEPLEVDR